MAKMWADNNMADIRSLSTINARANQQRYRDNDVQADATGAETLQSELRQLHTRINSEGGDLTKLASELLALKLLEDESGASVVLQSAASLQLQGCFSRRSFVQTLLSNKAKDRKLQIGPLCAWKLLQARLLIFDEYLVTLKQTCPPPLSNGALESILVTDFDWKLTLLNRKLDCYVAELVCLRWQTQVNPEEEVLLANELSEFHRQTFGHSSCLNSLDSSTLAAHPPPTWPDTVPPRPRAPMAVFEDLVA
eukprot:4432664-Pyramimonas_sp.AAC.1